VALSSDGNTALIGGDHDNSGVGAVWVFTRSGSTWTQQQKLSGSGEIGSALFGYSVALSSDGNTALIGGFNDNGGVGAAWVFTRAGSTWTQQQKVVDSTNDSNGYFGWSVALSSDGNTALIGADSDNGAVGAAWVFTRSASTWTQQGGKLVDSTNDSYAYFGWSVALSSDGNTALIGAPDDNSTGGFAWVFTRSGTTWTQQATLIDSTNDSYAFFGYSVALSSDGNTALVGGYGDGATGAAWVFTRAGSTWAQQAKLVDSTNDSYGYFGYSVALSSDGNTALIGGDDDNGGVGAAWVFTRAASTWTQQQKLSGSGESGSAMFGYSVALSSEGNTALIAGPYDNSHVGAAWVFAGAPTTTTLASSMNPTPAGQQVTYTATVSPVPDGGTVEFANNGVTITGCATDSVDRSNGTATCQTTYTATGSHPVTASYSGDSSYIGSASSTLTQTVTVPTASPGSTGPTGSTGSTGSPPSNAFTIDSDSGSSNGTITLGVGLPGAGMVQVLGTHEDVNASTASVLEPGGNRFDWGRDTVNATTAAAIKIKLKPDRDGKKLLARHRHYDWALNVSVWVTYTPTSGTARSKEIHVRVLKAKTH
jgi:hypothetical protein